MADYIVHHHHQQRVPLSQFMQEMWGRLKLGRIPPVTSIQGSVAAYINDGRWVAECPAGCGGAIVVSETQAIFICPDCGSPENGNNWYAVDYPAQKGAIEQVLLKRPARAPDRAHLRHWLPSETVADLKRQNRSRGFPEE